jgi:hypothetical protein
MTLAIGSSQKSSIPFPLASKLDLPAVHPTDVAPRFASPRNWLSGTANSALPQFMQMNSS